MESDNSTAEYSAGITETFTQAAADAAQRMRILIADGNATIRKLLRHGLSEACLLYTSPSPRDRQKSRMPSSA